MSKIMVIATIKLNDENLLEDWKTLSKKIDDDLAEVDGFISRDVIQAQDGVISCMLKWESRGDQEKFMEALTARTDAANMAIMAEFARVVDVENINQKFLTVL